MDLRSRKKYALFDLVDIERAKKGKQYKQGSICLQCSATKGQTAFLKNDQCVESKYAVLTLKTEEINPEYFYLIFESQIEEYLEKYQVGLNIRPELLKDMILELHTEKEAQKYVVEVMKSIQEKIDEEERIIKEIKQVKEYHLGGMFP